MRAADDAAADGRSAYTLRPPPVSGSGLREVQLRWPPPPPLTQERREVSQILDQLGFLQQQHESVRTRYLARVCALPGKAVEPPHDS